MIRTKQTGHRGPPSERARALWQRRMRHRLLVDQVVGSKWAELSAGSWFRVEAGELEPATDADWDKVESMLDRAIEKGQDVTGCSGVQWGSFYLGRDK